jgi:hypothetical protein
MINKVYISHDPEDDYLAEELADSLSRVGLDSFSCMNKGPSGLSRSERVSFGIRNSEVVVPIITLSGSISRTVNQEIGLSVGLERLIVPLLQEGAELPFMIGHLPPIEFSPDTFSDAEGQLIRTFRALTRLEWLKVSCPKCGEEMTQYLTTQENVDLAQSNETTLETICTYCESTISLDPRTFRPI